MQRGSKANKKNRSRQAFAIDESMNSLKLGGKGSFNRTKEKQTSSGTVDLEDEELVKLRDQMQFEVAKKTQSGGSFDGPFKKLASA